jgi:cytidine deaminase
MPGTISKTERRSLETAARGAAENAHAPYSGFRVGAAVLGAKGTYTGANVENASYGLSLCAERSALARAVAEGDRDIRAMAVACIDAPAGGPVEEMMPCGACRQWIAELAPHAEIVLAGVDEVFRVEDLLPRPFSLGRPATSPGRAASGRRAR